MKDHRKERAEARKKAEKLVSQMTLLEKASQLKYDAAPVKRLGVPAYNYWNEALHGVARAGCFPSTKPYCSIKYLSTGGKVAVIIANLPPISCIIFNP